MHKTELLHHLNDAAFITDKSFIIHFFNKASEKLINSQSQFIEGSSLFDILAFNQKNLKQTLTKQLEHEQSMQIELQLSTQSNKNIAVLMNISHIATNPSQYLIVSRDLSEQKETQKRLEALNSKLEQRAYFDILTGLPNRRFFEEQFEQLTFKRRSDDSNLYLACLDLNQFRSINDTYGHSQGDSLLQEVAKRLKTALRKEDLVARIGGDEFLILLNCKSTRALRAILKRVELAFQKPFKILQHNLAISTSIGVACFEQDALSFAELRRKADEAMYSAKKRNEVLSFYTKGLNLSLKRKSALEKDLSFAIQDGQLILHYQPISDLGDQRKHFFEALVRWNHPTKGLLTPDSFIPLAEETGLIQELDEWVLETAIKQAKTYGMGVSVNISATSFKNLPLTKLVKDHLLSTGLLAQDLQLEITETVLAHPEKTLSQLNQLRSLGVKIALDDFGMGYSSLAYLNTYPLDVLKLDRRFVQGLTLQDSTKTICEFIIRLAHDLNLSTIAEGVESHEQLEWLEGVGCDQVQGFLIQKPAPLGTNQVEA